MPLFQRFTIRAGRGYSHIHLELLPVGRRGLILMSIRLWALSTAVTSLLTNSPRRRVVHDSRFGAMHQLEGHLQLRGDPFTVQADEQSVM